MMLANLDHGGTYFFFAAFAIMGFLTVCKYLYTSPVSMLTSDRLLHSRNTSQDFRRDGRGLWSRAVYRGASDSVPGQASARIAYLGLPGCLVVA